METVRLLDAPQAPRPASGGTPPARRIRGVDAARALAIVGMVMVHVGPTDAPGAAGAIYGITHGRASVLFVLLAGVGVSILGGNGAAARIRDARLRLLFRALLLLPLGVALQELDTGVAVILQYYAIYFLVAILALRLPDHWLAGLAVGLAFTGPLAILVGQQVVPAWFEVGGATTIDEPVPLAGALLLTGYYPVVVWASPLLAGMWIGRRDLRAHQVQRGLLFTGAAIAAVAYGSAWMLAEILGPATDETQLGYLATAEAHSDMPPWIIGASGVAIAVLGGALLLGARYPRLIWPVTAMGQLALTIYVGHLIVLHLTPDVLVRDGVAGATFTVARFTVVMLFGATLWRALLPRGPLEAAFHAPWALTGRLRHRAGPPDTRREHVTITR